MERENEAVEQFISANRLLTTKEVMKMWPVSRSWLARYTARENSPLPSYKLGGSRLFKMEELLHWLDCHRTFPKSRRGRHSKKENLENVPTA